MIDYRILGALEVSTDGRVIEIGGPKLRALLAILLLRANESVQRDVVVHELWGEQPPADAQGSLDVYVSRLRKALDAAANGPVIVTRPGGYCLQVAEEHWSPHGEVAGVAAYTGECCRASGAFTPDVRGRLLHLLELHRCCDSQPASRGSSPPCALRCWEQG
jgi:DNA-binding SARP family transcriptional activator